MQIYFVLGNDFTQHNAHTSVQFKKKASNTPLGFKEESI